MASYPNNNSHQQAINWAKSRKEGNINVDNNGNLQFTVQQGVTTYRIKWIFVRTDAGSQGDASIQYELSNNQGYTLLNEKNVSLTLKNSAEVYTGPHTFTTVNNNEWTTLPFLETFPIGTKISLNFTKGANIKLCDNSNPKNALWIPDILDTVDNGEYNNVWMSIPSGILNFEIKGNITLYVNGSSTNNGNLSDDNPLNGLCIESGEAVLQSITIEAPPSALNQPN